ncbi:hypothetical protein IEQ44_05280 [Nocardioides sp. Y6]|uniref:DUF4254 domain-containing protein n=1 Tax=Nocardioides malaquae TaxID=2773426 RepID=A0ABR9RR68_9ACTN|nr:hypothetical protein [Nocardioides malaquae]MBE7324058.1 hypothetical protein [Nocardioides malaquae]
MSTSSTTGGTAPEQPHDGHRRPDAVDDLVAGLEGLSGRPPKVWRRELLDRLDRTRTLLVEESQGPDDWLQARRSSLLRERNSLLDRITLTRHRVIGTDDVDRVAYDVRRLAACLRRHLQRVNDVAWDEVELEVGGSE